MKNYAKAGVRKGKVAYRTPSGFKAKRSEDIKISRPVNTSKLASKYGTQTH